jgi:hypothetical protein
VTQWVRKHLDGCTARGMRGGFCRGRSKHPWVCAQPPHMKDPNEHACVHLISLQCFPELSPRRVTTSVRRAGGGAVVSWTLSDLKLKPRLPRGTVRSLGSIDSLGLEEERSRSPRTTSMHLTRADRLHDASIALAIRVTHTYAFRMGTDQ